MWSKIIGAVATIAPLVVDWIANGKVSPTAGVVAGGVGTAAIVANRVIAKRKAGAPVFRTKP